MNEPAGLVIREERIAERAPLGRTLLRAQGERIVFVIGDPAYYRRFGFSSTEARKFICPWSKEAGEAHMVLALRPAALNGIIGTVSYGRAFAPFIPAGEPPG